MEAKGFKRKFPTKGQKYSLEQFTEKYELDREEAEDLFYRFGPSSIDLDCSDGSETAAQTRVAVCGGVELGGAIFAPTFCTSRT